MTFWFEPYYTWYVYTCLVRVVGKICKITHFNAKIMKNQFKSQKIIIETARLYSSDINFNCIFSVKYAPQCTWIKGWKQLFGVERSKRPPERAYSSIPNRIYPFINCCFAKKMEWIGTEYGTASGSRACIPNFRLENGRACDFNDFFMNFEKYKLLTLIASYLIICRINHSHQLAEFIKCQKWIPCPWLPIGNIRDIQYINIELIDYVLNQSWILTV